MLKYSWRHSIRCIPLLKFLRSLREWAAVITFDVALLTCSVSVRQESSHTLRYFISFDGVRVLDSPSMFVGMVIEGPGPLCLPLLDFVK